MKTKIKDSIAEIEGELPWETLARHRDELLEELRQDFVAPGFRKGKVPMEVFRAQVNEHHVLEDAAERALQEAYPDIIAEQQLRTLGRPEVSVTKLAADNPLGFRISVGVAPEVRLPDYKKISAEIMAAEAPLAVGPEDVNKVMDELRALRREKDAPADAPLPELTDDFVKSMGDFQNVEDFRKKLEENIRLEKESERRRERREKIAEALVAKAKMILPASLLDAEAEAMRERMASDLAKSKMSMEDYLAKTKKTAEDLLKENRAYVERQLATRFILDAIAKAENIEADPQEVANEVRYLRSQHPQTDPESLERYAENVLRNEKVLRFLEGAPAAASTSPESQK